MRVPGSVVDVDVEIPSLLLIVFFDHPFPPAPLFAP